MDFSVGAKWRRQDYESSYDENHRWYYTGPDGVAESADDNLGQFISGADYAMFNGRYTSFGRVNNAAVRAMFARHPDYFAPTAETNDIRGVPPSHVSEDVHSAYLMARATFAKRLTVLGGLRAEATRIDSSGYYKSTLSPNSEFVNKDGAYEDLFPSLHLRYSPFARTLVRASYTTSMARPNLTQIAPTTTLDFSTSTTPIMHQNNPDLEPQYSKAWDVSVEYYLKPAGSISVGWFRKDIEDFIAAQYRTIGYGPDNGYNGDYAGYFMVTYTNLSKAWIEGWELHYKQQLTFLPKPFNSLSVFANHTDLKTGGQYYYGQTELPGFVPRVSSAGMSWRYGWLDLRVNYNHRSDYLGSFGTTRQEDQRYTANGTWDLYASCTLRRSWLSLYCNVVNLFNDWADTYVVDRSRLTRVNIFGTRVTVGVSGRF
jgi:TonB-dependent receptor